MMYWKFLIIGVIFISCSNRSINTLKHEKVKFEDLPVEVINCIKNPNDFQEERNNMLIQLPKGKDGNYKVENVNTLIGPWVSYVKLINTKKNISYKIDRGVPSPYILFENILYVPDRYNIFTTVEDLNTLGFTRYYLK